MYLKYMLVEAIFIMFSVLNSAASIVIDLDICFALFTVAPSEAN